MKILQSVPNDLHFLWQTELQLHNLRERNLSHLYRALIFIPPDREHNPLWDKLQAKFPEAKFFFYKDDGSCMRDIKACNYIPLLRPYCLKKHFSEYPELSKEPIWYYDADVLLLEGFDLSPFLGDSSCYVSDTGSYLNLAYLRSKESKIAPDKLSVYKQMNVVDQIAKQLGISEEIIEKNDSGTGGAQYLLKGVDAAFWEDVYNGCIKIRQYFSLMNQFLMQGSTSEEKENNGWQSWCADMWSVLWNLWKRGKTTVAPPELDFLWATSESSLLQGGKYGIFHNAGVTATKMLMLDKEEIFFYKSKMDYVNNVLSPHSEKEYLKSVSSRYCTKYYAEQLLQVQSPVF